MVKENSYQDLKNKFEDYIIIQKAGCFYDVRDFGAIFLSNKLGYSIYSDRSSQYKIGIPEHKISNAINIIKDSNYKYVLTEHYKIIEKYDVGLSIPTIMSQSKAKEQKYSNKFENALFHNLDNAFEALQDIISNNNLYAYSSQFFAKSLNINQNEIIVANENLSLQLKNLMYLYAQKHKNVKYKKENNDVYIVINKYEKILVQQSNNENILNDNTDGIVKQITDLINKKENIFITGGAGTGKSYILNQLKQIYGSKMHVTSTTGISALNISGQTIHSWAGIGIADKPVSTVVANIKNNNVVVLKQLLLAELLAIDEISMLDNTTLDYLNSVLKAIRESDEPFGGIQVLLFGDFFQLPPVGIEDDNETDFCFNSKTWQELNLKTIILKDVKRQTDIKFIKALNDVREDKIDIEDMKIFFKRDYDFDFVPPEGTLQIFSTNKKADEYNVECFNKIKTKSYKYIAEDYLYIYSKNGECDIVKISDNTNKLSEYDMNCINKFNEDCKAPQTLEIKVGCRVMLVKNRNIKAGLVNGSCGTVTEANDSSVRVLFDNKVESTIIPEKFEYIRENRTKIKRSQYPLRLAYGITIHKSQGMTFDGLVVNFNRIFDYGQAYVALSRTRSLEGLIIKGFNPNKIKANPKVINFYKEIEENGIYNPTNLIQNNKSLEMINNIKEINEFELKILKCVEMFNNAASRTRIARILVGSHSKTLTYEQRCSPFYGIIKNYEIRTIRKVIDELIFKGHIYQSDSCKNLLISKSGTEIINKHV